MMTNDRNMMWEYLKSLNRKKYFLPIVVYNDPQSEFVTNDIEESYKIENAREKNENSNPT